MATTTEPDARAKATVVDEIVAFNRDRDPKRVRLKFKRMAADSFAFFRGTDHLFAGAWARLRPPEVGPALLICGDLHLENFGAFRTEEGDLLFDINDFDEALVAPCGLDLVRCTTSILLAAQLWHFTPMQALRTVLTYLDRYRATVIRSVKSGKVGEVTLGNGHGPIWSLLGKAARGDQAEFLARHTQKSQHGKRRIKRAAGRYYSVDRKTKEQVSQAVEQYGSDVGRPDWYGVIDVANRIAGIGSLGLRRYAALVAGEGPARLHRLLDIKHAERSALSACTEAKQPAASCEALRVVQAQRLLQARPTAGLDVLQVGNDRYRMRELVPEENRASLDRLSRRPRALRRAVAVAGRITAWAHVRGSQYDGNDQSAELAEWARGPALESVIASAFRFAAQTRSDYRAFTAALDRTDLLRQFDE